MAKYKWYCYKCKQEFEEPDRDTWRDNHGMPGAFFEEFYQDSCPCCGSSFIEKGYRCPVCGKFSGEGHIHDHCRDTIERHLEPLYMDSACEDEDDFLEMLDDYVHYL